MNHEMIGAFHIIGHTFLLISHKPSKSFHNALAHPTDLPHQKTAKPAGNSRRRAVFKFSCGEWYDAKYRPDSILWNAESAVL